MVRRKYTLPRHTNLAPQGRRTGAFLIDLAVFLGTSLLMFFACFNLIFKSTTTPLRLERQQEQLNSHLRIMKDGEITQPAPGKERSYEVFSEVLSYYYMNYLTGEGIDPEVACRNAGELITLEDGSQVEKKNFYTVDWMNKNVFHVLVDDPDATKSTMFTYPKDAEGNYDKTKLVVPKDSADAPLDSVHAFMQHEYQIAYENFWNINYVYDLNNKITFIYTLEFVFSSLVGAMVTYVLIPWFMKNGQTFGKKCFGLALADKDGYIYKNKQLFMRVMPLLVCIVASLIPIWNEIYFILITYFIVFLVSFAVSMASPYKASLHDFTAGTIVVDFRSSILFNNELEEEAYLLKEDDLLPEESEGEEPELKYEK